MGGGAAKPQTSAPGQVPCANVSHGASLTARDVRNQPALCWRTLMTTEGQGLKGRFPQAPCGEKNLAAAHQLEE